MIYEYRCNKCGEINEFWMKMSDPHPEKCPACNDSDLERIISKTSFALKGSGWYTTDYKRKETGASGSKSKASSSVKSDKKSNEGNKACASSTGSKDTN